MIPYNSASETTALQTDWTKDRLHTRMKASYLCYTCMTFNTHTPGHPSTADHDV